jgi:hypothetical protein
LKQRSFIVDFNEKEGRVDVKEVGVLRGNLISERSIPYSQISKAGMRPTNVSINDEPAFVVTLQLTDSTIVDVSPEEDQQIAKARCHPLNKYLSEAKNTHISVQGMLLKTVRYIQQCLPVIRLEFGQSV